VRPLFLVSAGVVGTAGPMYSRNFSVGRLFLLPPARIGFKVVKRFNEGNVF
jgi:hypothetical protein